MSHLGLSPRPGGGGGSRTSPGAGGAFDEGGVGAVGLAEGQLLGVTCEEMDVGQRKGWPGVASGHQGPPVIGQCEGRPAVASGHQCPPTVGEYKECPGVASGHQCPPTVGQPEGCPGVASGHQHPSTIGQEKEYLEVPSGHQRPLTVGQHKEHPSKLRKPWATNPLRSPSQCKPVTPETPNWWHPTHVSRGAISCTTSDDRDIL